MGYRVYKNCKVCGVSGDKKAIYLSWYPKEINGMCTACAREYRINKRKERIKRNREKKKGKRF